MHTQLQYYLGKILGYESVLWFEILNINIKNIPLIKQQEQLHLRRNITHKSHKISIYIASLFHFANFYFKIFTCLYKLSFGCHSIKRRVSCKRGFSVIIAAVVSFKQSEAERGLNVLPRFVHVTSYVSLLLELDSNEMDYSVEQWNRGALHTTKSKQAKKSLSFNKPVEHLTLYDCFVSIYCIPGVSAWLYSPLCFGLKVAKMME